jgi:ribosome-binding factor A
MNERRIARIEQQIKERVATLLIHEIADPRLGFITISRVEMDKEMQRCIIYWSVLGNDKSQKLTTDALHNATGFLRREVASVLNTRSVPKLEFRHDDGVTGAVEMQELLDGLREERENRELTDDSEPKEDSEPT